MNVPDARSVLREWGTAIVGVVLVGLSLLNALLLDAGLVTEFLAVVIPVLVGGGLLAVTPRYRRLALDPALKTEIVATAAVVATIAAGAIVWEQTLLGSAGLAISLEGRVQSMLNAVAIGVAVGGAAGYDRARTKQELTERAAAQESYREIFEGVEDALLVEDFETSAILASNEKAADLFGYSRSELDGMAVPGLTADDPDFDMETARERIDAARAGDPQRFDWRIERADGEERWVLVSLKRATINGEDRLLASIRDIEDRRRRERQLEERALALEKYSEIYENADVGIALNDPETGTITEVNPKYAEIQGYPREALEGMSIDEISANSDSFNQDEAMEMIERAMAGEPQTFDWQVQQQDGTQIWVRVSLKQATIGTNVRLLAFVQDVTERKENERELDRHRSEMEFFNSLLRHDVLNAVTVIRTHGARLADSLEGDERDHAETIVEWSDNVSGIVERVRVVLETLTSESDGSFHPMDLSTTLEEEAAHLRSAHPDVAVETDVLADVHVQADDLLGDVFRNLLTNAVDHSERDDPSVTVTVEDGPKTVTVRIADTGPGIDDADKEAAFRRGETGHVKKTGSGFGLFFVDSMVSAYGGDVWFEDNDPEGAVVVVEIPAASGQPTPGDATPQ